MSLFLEMRFSGQVLAKGTGFIVEMGGSYFLITNLHNVTGRDPVTGKCLDDKTAAVPNEVAVYVTSHSPTVEGCRPVVIPLLDGDDSPQWVEHPELKGRADMVAIRIVHEDDMILLPYALTETPNFERKPSMQVSVIGFPFGLSGTGKVAIWVNGTIASEPCMDFDGLPLFLIDARTRSGQSGSPVIAHSTLLGIYSGRINAESDLGKVWKTSAILELVRHAAALSVNA
jgi:hypothetical protein